MTNDRTTIHIPRDSKLFKVISSIESSKPIWKVLEERVIDADREQWADRIFNEFVTRISGFYPEKKEILQKLWGLVVWRVIYGEQLQEAYIQEIEKIMKQP